jgi:cobalt-zinc-cadmium efflux system outer membrane protein
MRIRKTYLELSTTALLLVALPSRSLPQSVSQTPDEKSGVVVMAQAAKPAEPIQRGPSYARLIDPLGGLTADEMVRYALTHNGELLAIMQMISQAQGKLRQAGLRPNPMVEGSYQKAVASSDNNVTVGAELPLELGGRREARVAVVMREMEMRQAEVADFERRLAADVRMKYGDAIAAARNLKFTEDLLELARDSYRLVKARVDSGKIAPLEQNLVSVEVSRVDATRINFESKTQVAVFELKRAVGMQSNEPLRLRGEFFITRRPLSEGEALRAALTGRPDLGAARAAENLALAQLEQARVEGKVDASLFATYQRMNFGYSIRGFNGEGALVPVTGIFNYFAGGVRVTLPVRNKNQGSTQAAQADLEAARSRREFAEIIIQNEVAASYAREDRARAALEVYRDNVVGQAERNIDVIRQTYTLGQKSLLDYINEQRRFIDLQIGYTDALKEYFDSLVDIERAAGAPMAAQPQDDKK